MKPGHEVMRTTAAVAMEVYGHRALTATPSDLNSSLIPRTHIDIPYLKEGDINKFRKIF